MATHVDENGELRASVVVASFNAADVLGRCLDSLDRQRLPGGFETIVVNDASTDGTAALLRGYGDRVRVITRGETGGFSTANNDGARAARGRTLFLLNSDTELLTPDALERVVAAAEEPAVGIVGPLLVYPDRSLQPSCAAYPGVVASLLIATRAWTGLPDRLRARFVPQFWSHDRARDTDWLMGAALAVRREVWHDVGGFWPNVYAEEQDLAYRVRQRGLAVRFEPSARVMHVGNHSLGQRYSEVERLELTARAELAFIESHYARWRAIAVRAIVLWGYAARAIVHGLLGRRERARAFRRMARIYAGRG